MSLAFSTAGCGEPASSLVGKWTTENSSDVFEFYEDGKCELPSSVGGGYGEESYTVDSNNMLKLTNYYGSSTTLTYVSPEKADEFTENHPNSYWWYVDSNKLYINSKEYYYTKQ